MFAKLNKSSLAPVRTVLASKRRGGVIVIVMLLLTWVGSAFAVAAETTVAVAAESGAAMQFSTAMESAAGRLGVAVVAFPGNGLRIVAVSPSSPAAAAALQPGDFLLAVDGKRTSSLDELHQAIYGKQAGESIVVHVWRQGYELRRVMVLPARPEVAAAYEVQPWLGVFLQPRLGRGVLVERLHPQGPARKAGLKRGDVLIQIGGAPTDSLDDVSAAMKGLQPQELVDVVAQRGSKEEIFRVVLGGRPAAPGERTQPAPETPTYQVPQSDLSQGSLERLEGELQQLKEMVFQLREEVNALRGELEQRPAEHRDERSPQGTQNPSQESEGSFVPSAVEEAGTGEAASLVPANVRLPAETYLAQYRPYYRNRGRRPGIYRYPAPRTYYYYGYSYPYYRPAPSYGPYYGPYYYSYPNDGSYSYYYYGYSGPGFQLRVGPGVYFYYWR